MAYNPRPPSMVPGVPIVGAPFTIARESIYVFCVI